LDNHKCYLTANNVMLNFCSLH